MAIKTTDVLLTALGTRKAYSTTDDLLKGIERKYSKPVTQKAPDTLPMAQFGLHSVAALPMAGGEKRSATLEQVQTNLSQGKLTFPAFLPQAAARAESRLQAGREGEVQSLTDKLSSLQKERGKLDSQYTALMQDLGGFVPTGPTAVEADFLREQLSVINRDAREIERALYQKEREVKQGRYRGIVGAEDFSTFSAQGSSIHNPSLKDAEGAFTVAGKHFFGQEPGNIVTYSRANADQIALGEANDSQMVGKSLYRFMTDAEVNLYNYLLVKEGWESAGKFLDDLEETLNQRFGTRQGENVRGIQNPVGRTLATGFYGAGAGLDQWAGGMR